MITADQLLPHVIGDYVIQKQLRIYKKNSQPRITLISGTLFVLFNEWLTSCIR